MTTHQKRIIDLTTIVILFFCCALVWPDAEPDALQAYPVADKGCNSCHENGGQP